MDYLEAVPSQNGAGLRFWDFLMEKNCRNVVREDFERIFCLGEQETQMQEFSQSGPPSYEENRFSTTFFHY